MSEQEDRIADTLLSGRSGETVAGQARAFAAGVRDLARLPVGLDQAGTGQDGRAALALMGEKAVARLRAGCSRKISCIHSLGGIAIQARGRPSSGLTLRIAASEIAIIHHDVEARLNLASRPDLATQAMNAGASIELAHMVRNPGFDLKPYRDAAVILIEAAMYALATMTETLMDGPRRAAADDAIAGTRHAMAVCAAMIDTVRPGRLQTLAADMVSRTISAQVAPPFDDDADACDIDVPMPQALRHLMPGHQVITAFATVETTQPGSGKKPGLEELHVDFLPGMAQDGTMARHEPTELASLLREYGDDGSSLAAAVDAALATRTT